MEQSRKIELLKDYLDFEITHDFNDWDNTDFKVYTETTTDGYEVFIATFDDRNISICEDVYYYNNDLSSAVKQEITNGMVFYIEEYLYEDMYFDDELEEMFAEKIEDIIEEFEGTEEELNYLKEEYGIEDEKTETA